MAAPSGPRQMQGMLSRPTLRTHSSTPQPVQERYVGGRVSPMYWLTDIMPYISLPARRSLIASTVELVYEVDSYQMLVTDEVPDSSRLRNIFFAGLGVKHLHFRGEDSFDPEDDHDWILEQANQIVDRICTFIQDNLWEVDRPVKAILDPQRQLSRAEAWILRCSMHPEVIDGDEDLKAAWRRVLDDYLLSSADNWELDTTDSSFDYDDLIAMLSPGPEEEEMLYLNYNYDEVINGLSSEPEEWEEFELARDVELEPYGPQYKVEDLTELNLSPPKDEECAICLEGFDGQADELACRQLKVCNHSFHENCIDAWVNGSHAEIVTCPNCRAQICDARPRREKE